ncbi:MAG: sporulation transcriptional regulator SpoIIID [Clostridiales bacterium]|nr:sporulation transcriptional regulator SpoIIID [Clostridiales bacterium]
MNEHIEKRTLEVAKYIIDNKCTVRNAAKKFNISKSTVHKDVTERLLLINRNLFKLTKNILSKNKKERHIRGGIATKNKYKNL